jgi:hypothetical protein
MKYVELSLLIFSLLISNLAMATEYRGVITGIGAGSAYDTHCVGEDSCVVVKVASTHTKAGCNSNSWDFAFNSSSDTGKNTLSLVLAAELSKRLVVIGGTGLCDLNPTVEDLRYIYYQF